MHYKLNLIRVHHTYLCHRYNNHVTGSGTLTISVEAEGEQQRLPGPLAVQAQRLGGEED
jgi:hypothetical protein